MAAPPLHTWEVFLFFLSVALSPGHGEVNFAAQPGTTVSSPTECSTEYIWRAIDGIVTTHGCSTCGRVTPTHFLISFNCSQLVTGAAVTMESAFRNYTYELELSVDGTNFVSVVGASSRVGTRNAFSFPQVRAKYARLTVTALPSDTAWWPCAKEIEVLGLTNGTLCEPRSFRRCSQSSPYRVANFGATAPTPEITAEFWARVDSIDQNYPITLDPSPGDGTNRIAVHISYSGGGKSSASTGSVIWDFGDWHTTGRLSYAETEKSPGVWIHHAFVASQAANNMQIYRNGVLVASKSSMGPFTRGDYDLLLGRFNGELAEVRFWNTARTALQISANMNHYLTGSEANLVLHMPVDAPTVALADGDDDSSLLVLFIALPVGLVVGLVILVMFLVRRRRALLAKLSKTRVAPIPEWAQHIELPRAEVEPEESSRMVKLPADLPPSPRAESSAVRKLEPLKLEPLTGPKHKRSLAPKVKDDLDQYMRRSLAQGSMDRQEFCYSQLHDEGGQAWDDSAESVALTRVDAPKEELAECSDDQLLKISCYNPKSSMRSATELSPGQIVRGQYRILSLAGEGAFACVFHARDEGSRTEVALKLLKRPSDEAASRRLLREGRALARVSHPNVLRMRTIHGATPDDGLILVLEYVHGTSLKAELAELAADKGRPQGFSPAQVRRMALQVLDGLVALHAKRMVHRDIKPGNILVERGPRGDRDPRYILADLGVVKQMGTSSQDCDLEATGLTMTEGASLQGTLVYQSPESIGSANGKTEASTDLWAFAVTLFQMATGCFPFNVERGAVSVVFDLSRPEPLPTIVASVPSNLRGEWALLSQVAAKALSKAPGLRYQSAAEMLADIEGHMEYDIFLSYRVASERATARALYDQLNRLTRADGTPAKVFLDQTCLRVGEKWQEGFARALLSSSIVVPLVSAGSTGPLAGQDAPESHPSNPHLPVSRRLCPSAGRDFVDNVLLEWELALELARKGKVKAIIPVLIGRLDNGKYSSIFADGCLGAGGKFPAGKSEKTRERVLHFIEQAGMTPSQTLLDSGIQATVDELTSFQGLIVTDADNPVAEVGANIIRVFDRVGAVRQKPDL